MQEVPYPTLWNGILVVSISFSRRAMYYKKKAGYT